MNTHRTYAATAALSPTAKAIVRAYIRNDRMTLAGLQVEALEGNAPALVEALNYIIGVGPGPTAAELEAARTWREVDRDLRDQRRDEEMSNYAEAE